MISLAVAAFLLELISISFIVGIVYIFLKDGIKKAEAEKEKFLGRVKEKEEELKNTKRKIVKFTDTVLRYLEDIGALPDFVRRIKESTQSDLSEDGMLGYTSAPHSDSTLDSTDVKISRNSEGIDSNGKKSRVRADDEENVVELPIPEVENA
jgi:hypothetical protein